MNPWSSIVHTFYFNDIQRQIGKLDVSVDIVMWHYHWQAIDECIFTSLFFSQLQFYN